MSSQRMMILATKVPQKVKIEFLKLADDLDLNEAGLLRAAVMALLFRTGRLRVPEQMEETQ